LIKINYKIMVITVFSSILITLLVGLASIIVSMYVINKEASANLMLLTQNKAYIIEDAFRKIEVSTDDLANYVEISFSSENFDKYRINYLKNYTELLVPVVKKFIVNTDKAMGCYFNFDPNIVKSNTVYEAWVYDKTETGEKFDIVMTEPISNYYPIDKPELEWFYKPKMLGKPVWTDIYSDQTLFVLMISYIKPIYVKDKFIGIVGMDMSIEKLEKMIMDLKVYDTGYAFLLDKNFNIVVHKKYKINKKLEEINKTLFDALKINSIKKPMGLINYHYEGIDKVACYKKLNNGLIFVIAVPKSEMLRQKLNLQILLSGITLLSLILAALIMVNKK